MNGIDKLNPLTIMIYYVSVIGIIMFQMNPVMIVIALVGSIYMNYMYEDSVSLKKTKGYIGIFFIIALINPVFYHNGITVLFYLNDKPITLEALIYGIVMSATIILVIQLCGMMSKILSSDKILYLIGKISNKAALIISMALKLIPQYRKQADSIRETQKLLGFYKEDTIFDKVKGNLYVFSAVVTWSLEHSMETADSMRGRAYGTRKRTQYSNYKITMEDILIILLMLILDVLLIITMLVVNVNTVYYPAFFMPALSIEVCCYYVMYGILVSIIPIICTWEKIKWKYLMWKA